MTPLSSIVELDQADISEEKVATLSGARVLWADDHSLAQHFPYVLAPAGRGAGLGQVETDGPQRRRDFILANAAFVASSLTSPNEVCEPIRTTGQFRSAVRPPRYGRSLVVEAFPLDSGGGISPASTPLGLLDVKGVGVAPGLMPSRANHKNGILPLPMAIEELVNQLIIDRVLAQEGVDVSGVPLFALLDLGFRAKLESSTYLPCASLVRAAHRRPRGGVDLPEFGSDAQRAQIMIETILRRNGITSSSPMTTLTLVRSPEGGYSAVYAGNPIAALESRHVQQILQQLGVHLESGGAFSLEGINVQITREVSASPLTATIIDFGHYNIAPSASNPILSLVSDKTLNWGGILWPHELDALQSRLGAAKIPHELMPQPLPDSIVAWCGFAVDTPFPLVSRFGFEIAFQWAEGHFSAQDFDTEVKRFVIETLRLISDWRGICPASRAAFFTSPQ